jgi:hypothetical protein
MPGAKEQERDAETESQKWDGAKQEEKGHASAGL